MSAAEDIRKEAASLVALAIEKSVTISTAESCTGGGIGAAITGVSGSSAVYPGGVISYANEVKSGLLGVPEKMLEAHGAVSEPVAIAMAEGAIKLFKSDYSVSVTGIAGPTGGTDAKPVGLVYIATARRGSSAQAVEFKFGNIGREAVRLATTLEALKLLNARLP